MRGTCKTCGAETPNHVPSYLDKQGIGHPDHAMTPINNKEIEKIFWTIFNKYFPQPLVGNLPKFEAELTQAINSLLIDSRINEARHWDEHIIGSPRKVTVNERAKARLNQLKTLKGDSNE